MSAHSPQVKRLRSRPAIERPTEAQWRELLPSLELAGRERFGDEYFDRGAW
jgi:hypothetical protein